MRSLAASNQGTERVVAAAMAVKCVDKAAAAPAAPSSARPGADSGGDGVAGAAAAPTGILSCRTMNLDEVVMQASTQNLAGFPSAALKLINKALACKQEPRLFGYGVVYACRAHDAATAKRYFSKLPAQQQKQQLIQICAQEHITLP